MVRLQLSEGLLYFLNDMESYFYAEDEGEYLYIETLEFECYYKIWPETDAVIRRKGEQGWKRFVPRWQMPHTTLFQFRTEGWLTVPVGTQESDFYERINELGFAKDETILNKQYLWSIREAFEIVYRYSNRIWNQIPKQYRTVMRRHPDHRWALLWGNSQSSYFEGLINSNQWLAIALAEQILKMESAMAFQQNKENLLHCMVQKSQAEIAEFLGFSQPKLAVKLLKKLSLGAEINAVGWIMDLMQQGAPVEEYVHLIEIAPECLDFMMQIHPYPLVSPKFYRLIDPVGVRKFEYDGNFKSKVICSKKENWPRWEYTISRLTEISQVAKEVGAVSLSPAQNWGGLRQIDHELRLRLSQKNVENIVFPEPPFVGNEKISPICTALALVEEGRRMHHCIGGYYNDVVQRKGYAYHMNLPEESTWWITERSWDKQWEIRECAGRRNASVSSESRSVFQKWLDQSNEKINL